MPEDKELVNMLRAVIQEEMQTVRQEVRTIVQEELQPVNERLGVLEAGQTELKKGQHALEMEQQTISIRLADLQDGQHALEMGQRALETVQQRIETTVNDIRAANRKTHIEILSWRISGALNLMRKKRSDNQPWSNLYVFDKDANMLNVLLCGASDTNLVAQPFKDEVMAFGGDPWYYHIILYKLAGK